MSFRLLYILCTVGTVLCSHFDAGESPFSDRFIEYVNQKSKTWKAGRNFPESTSLNELKKRLGALIDHEEHSRRASKYDIPMDFKIPLEFDSRINWNFCPSIHEIRDQGSCGSCWAFSSVEVMTDRNCIHSNGKNNFHYSAQHLVSCCSDCGNGCNGGYSSRAFDYWAANGIVSGGPFNSSLGCYPYQSYTGVTTKCQRECVRGYNKEFTEDKHFGMMQVYLKDEKSIMYEIINNGPVVGVYEVYSDFYSYKYGVYQHTTGSFSGLHAIKILGYGVEDGVPYWLCANSWNYDWGDQGFFKILRGTNECGIESQVVAGLPKK